MGKRKFQIVLMTGKEDNGKRATLAFACGLSSLASGHETSIFLTGDGTTWAFQGSADQIVAQGFPPISQLIHQYISEGGSLLVCSACSKHCSSGPPSQEIDESRFHEGVKTVGFTTAIANAIAGSSISF